MPKINPWKLRTFLSITKGFDHIVRAVKNLCNHLELIFQDKEIDPDVQKKNLNIVKMIMYLFTQVMKTKDTKLAADVSSPIGIFKNAFLTHAMTFR